jgi:hypothetical protein
VRGPRVGEGKADEDAIRGRRGGDACNFGSTGVEFHRFSRKERGRTLLRTAVPFRPSNPRGGRSVTEDGSSGDVG